MPGGSVPGCGYGKGATGHLGSGRPGPPSPWMSVPLQTAGYSWPSEAPTTVPAAHGPCGMQGTAMMVPPTSPRALDADVEL